MTEGGKLNAKTEILSAKYAKRAGNNSDFTTEDTEGTERRIG